MYPSLCKKRIGSLKKRGTLPISIEGGALDVKNLSTQKASEKKGTRFQKENEDCRRQKRPQEKTRKGQKKTDLLIFQVGRKRPHKNTACRSSDYALDCGVFVFRSKNLQRKQLTR